MAAGRATPIPSADDSGVPAAALVMGNVGTLAAAGRRFGLPGSLATV